MATKVISIKKFRKNMTKVWNDARDNSIRYVVMYHSTPIFEVTPINEEEFILENLAKDIEDARKEIKEGKFHSEEEVYAALGL